MMEDSYFHEFTFFFEFSIVMSISLLLAIEATNMLLFEASSSLDEGWGGMEHLLETLGMIILSI